MRAVSRLTLALVRLPPTWSLVSTSTSDLHVTGAHFHEAPVKAAVVVAWGASLVSKVSDPPSSAFDIPDIRFQFNQLLGQVTGEVPLHYDPRFGIGSEVAF